MKKIKFLTFIFLMLVSVLTLASCDFGKKDNNGGETYTAGITCTSDKINLNVGDLFEPLNGVTAINSKGESVLDQVTVNTTAKLDEEGHVIASGEYSVKYTVTIDGELYNLYRTLIVAYVAPETDDLVINGDFESGSVDPFTKSEFDNGVATLKVIQEGENNVLSMELVGVSWQKASPRLETNIFELESGKAYEISFKIKADAERKFLVQLGELLSGAPWFNALVDEEHAVTTEWQEVSVKFVADASKADLAKLQLLFGFGTFDGNAIATTIYLDDIKVEETKIDSLLNAETFAKGDEAAAKANPGQATLWYVENADWGCGAVVEASATLEDGVVTIESNMGEGSFWFATQLFLYSAELEAGVYHVSFNLNSNVAGKVQVNKQVFELVAGDNVIEYDVELASAGLVGISLQLGCEADASNLGECKVVLSDILALKTGEYVVLDYADPENLFGTPAAAIVNDGESKALENPNTFYVWYVQDAGWSCGPVVSCTYGYENGEVSLNATLNDTHYWFAVQLFYATKPIQAAGSHVLTFDLESNVAGTITICGTKYDIIAGTNSITVNFENEANAQFLLSVQLGWEEVLEDKTTVSHQLIGADELVFSNFAIDGIAAGEPEEPVDFNVAAGDFFKGATVKNGDEPTAQTDPGSVYLWYDQNWCGSNVNADASIDENGVLSLNINSVTGTCWFGTQLFFFKEVEGGSLKIQIGASKACTIQLNDQPYELEAGVNTITLDVSAGTFEFDFQAGTETTGQVGAAQFQFSANFGE